MEDIQYTWETGGLESRKQSTMETLPASSSIVFEMFADGTIKGYLNDEEYTLGGCEPGQPCKRSDFEQYVQ